MATYDFKLTAKQMIQTVMEDLAVVTSGVAPAAADETMALRRLNIVIKRLAAHPQLGLKPYRRRRITLFLQEGQHEYSIPSSNVHATFMYGRTTLDAAEAAAQTVISVTATSDATTNPGTTLQMKPGDSAGVQQDNGEIFWSTITARAADDTVTLASGIDAVAASGKYFWWYTEPAPRLLEVESALLRYASLTDVPLAVYNNLSRPYDEGNANKYADGRPTTVWVEHTATATRILLDTQPTDVTDQIILTALLPFADYDSVREDIVVPQEALALVQWELAFALSPGRGRWTQQMKDNRQMAWDAASRLNPETCDLYYQPNA